MESAAFWMLCAYLMFEYVRPQSVYPAIDIIPWPIITLILTVLTVFFDKSVKWVSSTETPLFLLFFLIVLLSGVFAFRSSLSWAQIDIVINWVIVYFLIISIVNTEKRFFIFILLFLLASFKMSQHGFMTSARRGFSFADWGATGAPGWFHNSGEFAIQMTIFVPLSICFILSLQENWGRIKKLFFYLMPITGLVSVAATSSRGAQLAIAVTGAWFVLKNKLGIKALVGIAVLGIALYLFLPEEQISRIREIGQDETSLQRLAYWSFGLDVMADHPLLGIGYANWTNYCYFINPQGVGVLAKCEVCHNIFIQAVSELGISGLSMFILMALFVFIINARTRECARQVENKFLIYMAHGLDGGLIGYLVSGFFVTVLFYPFFWIQMSMTVALNAIARSRCEAHQKTGGLSLTE
jgi:O-antigen ligase